MSRARLQWIDHERKLREYALTETAEPILVGRHPACSVCVDDPHVSRRHLLLTMVGGAWFVEDVSGVGAFLERGVRARLQSRRSLASGDRLHIGGMTLVYKDEDELDGVKTVTVDDRERVALTAKEQQVLEHLCHPVVNGSGPPVSNEELAEQLVLSMDGVRSHLKSMYRKFGVTTGTAAQRRAQLVQRAIDGGHVLPPN